MSDETIASSLLRQEGPQQEELHDQLIAADALIASMKRALQGWLDANAPGGWIDDLRQAAHTRLTDLAAAQARIEVLEGSIDYLRNLVDDRRKPGWLPIDTAQEDGEIVLVFDEGAMFRALIEKGRWIDIECDQPVEPPPSHWMPMPKPPTVHPVPPAEGEK